AAGYTDDTLALNLRSSRGEVKTVFGGLYAGALYGALDIKLGVMGGGTQATTQRTVLFPSFMDTAHGRGDGTLVQGFGEVGYRIGLPEGAARGYVEPVVQGAVIHVDQDGLRETGGSAALRVSSRSADVGTTTLGVRSEVSLSAALPVMAHGFVGWRRAFGDVVPRALVGFGGGATPFAVAGTPIDRNAAVAEFGLDYRASAAMTLGVSYSAQVGSRASDQSVKGRLEYRF
ncbi:autotransporter outer membrane beta-barrel domain-containing protein, partial [Methylobacterium persicinum]|uniref:autotransporter outer membrane beta-barrel domain-containing protein n=1 Tax=Methylobacterium persicinum TaxID=374426 RepID=UPI001EE18427